MSPTLTPINTLRLAGIRAYLSATSGATVAKGGLYRLRGNPLVRISDRIKAMVMALAVAISLAAVAVAGAVGSGSRHTQPRLGPTGNDATHPRRDRDRKCSAVHERGDVAGSAQGAEACSSPPTGPTWPAR
jgi:hypothetical protein